LKLLQWQIFTDEYLRKPYSHRREFMTDDGTITETRDVRDFDRVTLKEFGKLNIVQSEAEALTIETYPYLMPKIISEVRGGELILGIKGGFLDRFTNFLSTSFSGHRITYNLTVKNLRALSISGAASVSQKELLTDSIAYKLSGAGSIDAKGLSAESVEVNLSGTGKIELGGKAKEQKIIISGAGGYIAQKLETRRAKVKLSGAGKAIIWAIENLEIRISGLGSVDYYGEPKMHTDITGLGNIVGLGEPKSVNE
jgi:hypothetical protein